MEELNPIVPPYLRAHDRSPIRRLAPKMGRNDICKLEGVKFKNCCGKNGYKFCVKLFNEYFEERLKSADQNKISSLETESKSSSEQSSI